jgi:ribosomal protein S18 acetylase RimI-like enzyme
MAMTEIREARLDDAAELAATGACVWVDTYAAQGVRPSIANFVLKEFTRKSMENTISSKHVLVAVSSNHILGYSVVCPKTAEMETLYVLPKLQRRGVGDSLLRTAIESYGHLWLSCWEENAQAIIFYKSYGFEEIGEAYFDLEGENHRNIVLQIG